MWNNFILGLEFGRVRLSSHRDSLIWTYLKYAGDISAAKGYDLIVHRCHKSSPDLSKVLDIIWTFNIPAKICRFIWLAVMNRVLTRDNLQKRGWQGPGMCILCRRNEDSSQHLFLDCTVSKRVFTVFLEQWGVPFIKKCSVRTFMELWYKSISIHSSSSYLPLFIFWSLWKMRNSCLFENKLFSMTTILHQVKALYLLYPALKQKLKIRNIGLSP